VQLDQAEVEKLAREISERVWAKVRRLIARQQRELHDLLDDEEE
jgi:hypothetical protein